MYAIFIYNKFLYKFDSDVSLREVNLGSPDLEFCM